MGEMVDRMAMWLHQHHAADDQKTLVPWSELDGEQRAALLAAARDLILTMRRPTLSMRVLGRASMAKGEGEVWRTMVDGALKDDP